MSTANKPGSVPGPKPITSVRVVSHTGLFYWWPVWATGLIFSALTYFGGGRLAVVPDGTKVTATGEKTYELTVPERPTPSLTQAAEASAQGQDAFPVRVSGNRDFGMVYVVVLLLVIFGSNVPLRGLWTVVAILLILVLTAVLAYFDVWGWILDTLGGLHVEISLAGYLVPSLVLLALWLVTVFGFYQMRYVIVTPGQFVVHQAIGDAREVYDAGRATVQKRRSDLFRHWVLGLGAGDLIISVPSLGKEIVLHDVLFVGRKVRAIAELMKTRPVTALVTEVQRKD
jgi:hypothetical protein